MTEPFVEDRVELVTLSGAYLGADSWGTQNERIHVSAQLMRCVQTIGCCT